MTFRAFAAIVGADASNISKYEAGRITPGAKILVNLFRLAEGDEREPFRDLLGLNPAGPETVSVEDDALDRFVGYMRQGGVGIGNLDASHRRLLEVVKQLSEIEIEPAIIGILEKWVEHHKNRKARRFFKNLDVYLDIELSRLEGKETKE